jgi:hypothetical protein
MNRSSCTDCGGTLEVGYIADRGDYNALSVPLWVAGEPEASRFLGLSAGLKVKDRPQYEVLTYRCRLCGLLKAYAPASRAK